MSADDHAGGAPAVRVRQELRTTGRGAALTAGAGHAGVVSVGADRADAARARAARAGRRRAGALAGAVCLAVLTSTSAALWPGWPSRLAAAGSPARASTPPGADPLGGPADDPADDLARAARGGLDPAAVLTQAELEPVVPSARVITASVAEPNAVAVAGGGVTGGWCGDEPLDGVETPAIRWWVGWGPQVSAPAGALPPLVTEQVLRFGRPDAAARYVAATVASPTRCFDSFDSTSPGRAYAQQGALEADGSPVAVAAADVANAPGTYSVRALRGRGGTVVDLTVRLDAESADAAGTTVLDLLDAALSRAVAGTDDDATGSTRPIGRRLPAPDRPPVPDPRREPGQPQPGRSTVA